MKTISFNDYEFSVIKDNRGIRLGSCPSIKSFVPDEVARYASALNSLDNFIKELMNANLNKIEGFK